MSFYSSTFLFLYYSQLPSFFVLSQVFLYPLKTQQTILAVSHIYAEIEVILAFSRLLLQDLEPRVENWDHRRCIADVILGITDYMKVYTQYVKDYSVFVDQIARAKEDGAFCAILKV